jgi:hypothetical protein
MMIRIKSKSPAKASNHETILPSKICAMNRGSSGSIVSDYGLDDRAIDFDHRQTISIFPLASVSRPVLGPTQPPVQWVQGVLSPGQSAAGA